MLAAVPRSRQSSRVRRGLTKSHRRSEARDASGTGLDTQEMGAVCRSGWLRTRRAANSPPTGSANAFLQNDDADGLQDDRDVAQPAVILHIVQVVFQLARGVGDGGAIGIVDLRPAGQARLHAMAQGEHLNFLANLVDEDRAFGT